MKALAEGFAYNIKGLRYFWQQKSLWKFVLLPLSINLLLFFVFLSLGLHYADDLLAFLLGPLEGFLTVTAEGFWNTILAALAWLLLLLLKVVFYLLSLIILWVLVYLMSSLVNSPFYERLSESVLKIRGAVEARVFSWRFFFSELGRSLKIELGKALLFATVIVFLTALSWLPAVGPVFVFLQILVLSWLFAWGLCAYPLLVKGLAFKQILLLGLQNKLLLVGFGLFSLVPVVGILMMPFQIVGGTLLCLDRMWDKS